MADRSAAALFGMLFNHLAGKKPLDPETIWSLSQGYDFSPIQMGCDDALKKLGLLWVCRSEQCLANNDDYGVHVYGPNSRCRECGAESTD